MHNAFIKTNSHQKLNSKTTNQLFRTTDPADHPSVARAAARHYTRPHFLRSPNKIPICQLADGTDGVVRAPLQNPHTAN